MEGVVVWCVVVRCAVCGVWWCAVCGGVCACVRVCRCVGVVRGMWRVVRSARCVVCDVWCVVVVVVDGRAGGWRSEAEGEGECALESK